MKILALQLKRIGDLILTTPALEALRTAFPEAHLALAVAPGCAGLLGAIEPLGTGIVLGRGRGFAPWQQVLTGPWDLCLDFTGTDRSALATAASRAKERVTFAWVQRSKWRALAYHRFVESSVRERPTMDHYLDLVRSVVPGDPAFLDAPRLLIPDAANAEAATLLREAGIDGPFVLLHPGSARSEKYWLPERWAEVIAALRLPVVLTGGSDDFERAHLAAIQRKLSKPVVDLGGRGDLLTLAALVARAELVLSCDTAVVHLAAAFARPQIALFGPTNPFHWRPRHAQAVVLSAAQSDSPLREFSPRMKGAPMERISTALVFDAISTLSPPLI